jgi:tetratricopeptide (TPR) repeat protein
MMLHAYEQHGLASLYYERASQLAPAAIAWPYLSGVVHAELGQNKRAMASFRQALVIDRVYLPARLRLAEVLLADGDPAASRAEYEDLVRSFPELALAHYGLGRALAALGDVMGALNRYRQAVDLAPQFGSAHYALGLAYRDSDMPERATRHLEAYRQFSARRPTMRDPFVDEVRSLVGTAREMIAQAAQAAGLGELQEAIALHLKALEADPRAAQAHVNLISLYGRTGRPDSAEQHYRQAVHLGSHLADAHYNYGVLQASAGRYVDAENAFRSAISVDPFHVRAHNNLGALLAQQGKREEAVEHYRQALASDPQHQAARFGLGRLLVSLGRPGEAVEQLQKLLVPESPDTPRYKYALANAWLASGDTRRALHYAEQAHLDAKRLGQAELADTIERELERLKKVVRQ